MSVERLNENSYITYPFLEDTIMKAGTGEEIPDSMLLDISVDLHFNPLDSFKLSALSITASYVTATFSVTSDSGVETVALVAPASLVDSYQTTAVVAGKMAVLATFGPGVTDLCTNYSGQTFAMALVVEPGRVSSTYAHMVTSISAPGGDTLTGDVKFVEGYNIGVSLIQATNTLSLSAQRNGGEGMPCSKAEEQLGDCGSSMYHINGLRPDWYGNMLLRGGKGITVTGFPDENKIVIKSAGKSCKPGCNDA